MARSFERVEKVVKATLGGEGRPSAWQANFLCLGVYNHSGQREERERRLAARNFLQHRKGESGKS